MRIQILDLDGSLPFQKKLLVTHQPAIFAAQDWGPRIRLACSFRRFRQFERALENWSGQAASSQPAVSLLGSGDFHHVSLALVKRLQTPINLLVLDNHPDWMRFVPFLHCGTWLYHAARLPNVEQVFHVGGDVDFDNYYQWIAPWRQLRSGKITVLPAIRRFERGAWSGLGNQPLRVEREAPVTTERVSELLQPFRGQLASRPLYISLDKDVLMAREAVVNWDSGHLTLPEILVVLNTFLVQANGNLAGMDLVGDWSPVRLRGWLRWLMHLTMHPALEIDPTEATRANQEGNLALLGALLPHL